jgi:cation:H+ antiporter
MGHAKQMKNQHATAKKVSTARAGVAFAAAAVATLAAGYALEQSGDQIAGHIGLTGVLFGSTVLAAATSLPELSTGITSVRLGDIQLAMSDIFGGNAFLPVLFLLATLIAGRPCRKPAIPTSTLPAWGSCSPRSTSSGSSFGPAARSPGWGRTR